MTYSLEQVKARIRFRVAKKDSFCRLCDCENKKDVDMIVSFHSKRGLIVLCRDCTINMGIIASGLSDEKNKKSETQKT